MNSDTVTQTEAARLVGMTKRGVKRWVDNGWLPAIKVGRIVLIKVSDLEEMNNKSLLNPQRKRWIKAS